MRSRCSTRRGRHRRAFEAARLDGRPGQDRADLGNRPREQLLRLPAPASRTRRSAPVVVVLLAGERFDQLVAEARLRLEVAHAALVAELGQLAPPWRSPRSSRRSRRPGRAGAPCRRPTRGPGRSGRPLRASCAATAATIARKRPVDRFDAGLDQLAGLGRRALEQVRLARQRRGLDAVGADPELGQRALEARQHPEHADRTGDRRRLGEDVVAGVETQ